MFDKMFQNFNLSTIVVGNFTIFLNISSKDSGQGVLIFFSEIRGQGFFDGRFSLFRLASERPSPPVVAASAL